MAHLCPSGCGRSPALSSSSPEEGPGSRNSVPLVQSKPKLSPVQSLSPRGLVFVPGSVQCCVAVPRLAFGPCGYYGERERANGSAGAQEWMANKCLLPSQRPLLSFDSIISGFQTDQYHSQSFMGLCWALSLTNLSFPRLDIFPSWLPSWLLLCMP